MQKDLKIQFLIWDSEFFGYKIGLYNVINESFNLEDIVSEAQKNFYKLIYIKSNTLINTFDKLSTINILLADKKTTFGLHVRSAPFKYYNQELYLYNKLEINDQLLSIALQSGKHSRFNIDPNFTNGEYQKLYTQWIKKSVSGELAKEVWVNKSSLNIITGLITIGVKDKAADIGLLAVDSNFRGNQLGKSLVNKAVQQTFNWGLDKLQVITQLDNIGACRFYESCGFSLEKTEYIYHLWLK